MAEFNPNELVIDHVLSVESYTPNGQLKGRYTEVEDPSLQLSADKTEVLSALGNTITELYRGQKGTFSFTNSLFSTDLLASQFGAEKEVGNATNKILTHVSEFVPIVDSVATLSNVPVGTKGAEVAYVSVTEDTRTFTKSLKVGSTVAEGVFTIDAEQKKITLPSGITGKIFVQYETEKEEAIKIVKKSDSTPDTESLLITVMFKDVCDPNKKVFGYLWIAQAQIDASSVDINLTSEGKHAATYNIQKKYCDPDGNLVEVVIAA